MTWLVVGTALTYVLIIADRIYFAIRFAECKRCGWITKNEVGLCNGCGGKR